MKKSLLFDQLKKLIVELNNFGRVDAMFKGQSYQDCAHYRQPRLEMLQNS